jgi:hypothetical protein
MNRVGIRGSEKGSGVKKEVNSHRVTEIGKSERISELP